MLAATWTAPTHAVSLTCCGDAQGNIQVEAAACQLKVERGGKRGRQKQPGDSGSGRRIWRQRHAVSVGVAVAAAACALLLVH